jgi:nucleoside-diphosphate-sugar epimerase
LNTKELPTELAWPDVEAAFTGQRVLVTGAAGFIGTALCQRLGDLGATVHGVSRRPQDRADVLWWTTDLAEKGTADRVIGESQPDLIFHLASHVTGTRDLDAVMPTFRDNLLTTINVLTAACNAGGPRVVLAATSHEPSPDDPDDVPCSPYAAAKIAAADYTRMFHALYGLSVVRVRVLMAYGPGQWDGTKLVPYVVNCLLHGERPELTSGNQEIDWIYVDDVVDAFLRAGRSDDAEGQTLDVGSGELVTARTVVKELVRLTGCEVQPIFGTLPDRPMERRRVADTARTRRLIGWEPSTPLKTGLARTVQWFRDRKP